MFYGVLCCIEQYMRWLFCSGIGWVGLESITTTALVCDLDCQACDIGLRSYIEKAYAGAVGSDFVLLDDMHDFIVRR